MYYTIRITTNGDYVCKDYFDKQLICLENEDTNRHFQGIVFTDKNPKTVRKYLERNAGKETYSFVEVRSPKQCHKYFVNNPEKPNPKIVVDTIPKEELKVFFMSGQTPKVSHKKGETFIQFVKQTFVKVEDEYANVFETRCRKHILNCFIEKDIEFSKTKFRNIYQTMVITFAPVASSPVHVIQDRLDYIPKTWFEFEN